ncbi:hypothetical protein KBC79_01425 [Candidatus Woesebacteria bacterium]|nr:hypothetical protein [Candidatus Woesebacteria bacterium]
MQDTKLPTGLFCKCEYGTPCFDTIHEIEKWHADELSTCKQELIEWAEGEKKYSPFSRSENIAEPIREYNRALSDLINHIKGEK